MYICRLRHKNGLEGDLYRNHSVEWEIKLSNGKSIVGANLLDHVMRDIKDETLTVVDGTLPIVVK